VHTVYYAIRVHTVYYAVHVHTVYYAVHVHTVYYAVHVHTVYYAVHVILQNTVPSVYSTMATNIKGTDCFHTEQSFDRYYRYCVIHVHVIQCSIVVITVLY